MIKFEAYTINENNYFKLRDVAKVFNIGVDYDVLSKAVIISTDFDYISDAENMENFRIEGESGKLKGSHIRKEIQAEASGGMIVSYFQDINDTVMYSNVPKSAGITIGYTRGNYGPGKLAFYIEDVRIKEIEFTNTDSWQKFSEIFVPLDIPEGADVRFVIESKDSAVNIDYIDFHTLK